MHIGDIGVVRATDVTYGAGGSACVTFEAVGDGETDVTFGDDKLSTYWNVEVRDGAILCAGINFSGWESILICICIFLGVAAALCASVLVQLQRSRWFDYGMVAACGGMLFLLFQFLLFTFMLVRGSLRNFSDLAYMLTSAADAFTIIGLIPMALLCLLVSLSNLVPGGGQGPDEVISEAQSMRDYLVSQGVRPDRIVLEDRSATTNENMEFSRKVIEEHAGRDAGELLVGFSTTNYHVFRGYVCAHRAGMAVQGMGSRTRAYFWPNAFLREFAGLLASRWKGILVTYVAIGAVYASASYALILMGENPAIFVA